MLPHRSIGGPDQHYLLIQLDIVVGSVCGICFVSSYRYDSCDGTKFSAATVRKRGGARITSPSVGLYQLRTHPQHAERHVQTSRDSAQAFFSPFHRCPSEIHKLSFPVSVLHLATAIRIPLSHTMHGWHVWRSCHVAEHVSAKRTQAKASSPHTTACARTRAAPPSPL